MCIICKKNVVSHIYKPFCCKRCADIDLHRWTTQSYALPAEDVEYADSIAGESEYIK